ncbi:MAG: sigma-70 family RNA polymerase sigma factor [Chitinophagales bacterium]
MLEKDQNSYQLSDEDIILQFKATLDNYYVGILFERYVHLIFGICLKYMKNRHDAEDVMVEIYEKLQHTIPYKDVGKFRNWLAVLVRNYCVSKLRSLQTESKRIQSYKEYVNHLNLNESGANEEQSINYVSEEKIKEAVMSLPHLQQVCIEYFYFDNKSYLEIALLLNEEVGKIRSYIQNGRRNLKIVLSKKK